jgi:stearoyl-CoA desaturase (delta-9 desaturase)
MWSLRVNSRIFMGIIKTMTRIEKAANLLAVVVPFVAFVVAVVLLWHQAVGPADLALFGGMYLITALGVTIGYHRLLTHKAFEAPRAVRYTLAVLGSMAVQGPVLDWVADHRKHHAFTDREGDPHSPHDHDSGLRGLIHAHMGWLVSTQGQAPKRQFARDLFEDPGMRLINRLFPAIALAGLLIPAGIGAAVGGAGGALTGLLWGGLVRVFFVHHVTWSVNSVCHFFGTRRFDTRDQSTNVAWLALPSLGESWHHNHPAFPRSARHGLRPWEVDLSGLVIAGMAKVGLAREVVLVEPEDERRRLAGVRGEAPVAPAA